jgi:hypothetical protein
MASTDFTITDDEISEAEALLLEAHGPLEMARLIIELNERINYLTNVNDGLRETLDAQRAGLAKLRAMLVAEKPA